ncbi:uncharacterized protein LTR77_007154 [Saxophila tyrrhenica]|uniref:AB hydrolase-1 domain-containing protein n=1 Tax=Saxophila tyrrhenica TaxID=1690608 RepID=A0AAV9P7Y3_9PEZI|nr:hypothetical protein LTR77_007154 [Saxophila tyrrhenica]
MAQQFKLPDGRNLDYSLTGATDGFPLVWHHGTPSGYTAIPVLATACEKRRFRLITFSRSGYGGSSRQKGRQIVDAVGDVRALLEHLGYQKCVVGGWSGGGPHALACAAKLESCLGVISVAAVAPYDAEGLDWISGQGEDNIEESKAALEGEDALREFCEARRPDMIKGTAAEITQMMESILPEVDKRVLLESREFGKYMETTTREGLKSSSDGWIDDDLAFIKPWGFEMTDIQCPVSLYQGSEDLMVPYDHGKWLGSHIPEHLLTKHLEGGEGHISIFEGNIEGMLDEMRRAIDSRS